MANKIDTIKVHNDNGPFHVMIHNITYIKPHPDGSLIGLSGSSEVNVKESLDAILKMIEDTGRTVI